MNASPDPCENICIIAQSRRAGFAQNRFDAKPIHTHMFKMEEVPTALKYSRDRIGGAITVMVKVRNA